jgi:squalene synthase HpnC
MAVNNPCSVNEAYDECLKIVRGHYENFPVATFFLPKPLRKPIAAIYAFARTADDFADEGDLQRHVRIEKLNNYAERIKLIKKTGQANEPIFIALADTIKNHQLPAKLFLDLLSAFRQDVTVTRYANFSDVLAYCQLSANPVGRLLLHTLKIATPTNLQQSDAICSSLQLINFLQDIGQDYDENNRIYLPQDEMKQYNVNEDQISNRINNNALHSFFLFQVNRARKMMLQGAPLGNTIKGRFGFQLRLMISGGLQILAALEKQTDDIFSRPRLTTYDWISMVRYALLKVQLGKTG